MEIKYCVKAFLATIIIIVKASVKVSTTFLKVTRLVFRVSNLGIATANDLSINHAGFFTTAIGVVTTTIKFNSRKTATAPADFDKRY